MSPTQSVREPAAAARPGRWGTTLVIGGIGAVFGGAAAWFGAWSMTGVAPAVLGPVLGFAVLGAVITLALAADVLRRSQSNAMTTASGARSEDAAASPTSSDVEPGPPVQPPRVFHALLDAVPHLMWRADRHGVIVHANQAWLREFRRLRPLHVEDLIEVLADDDAGAFIGAWDAARHDGGEIRLRCRLNRPDAEPRWTDLDIRAVRTEAGVLDGWVGIFADVHEALMKIESAQQSLSDERRLRERAERIAAMKDEFVATVSHELRSPLNAIAGWTEILSRERNLDESAVRAIAVVQRNVRAQSRLIGDLEQLSSVVTGRVAPSPTQVDLGASARGVAERHAAAALARRIVLTCDRIAFAPVYVDAPQVELAIGNMVGNAIQFTPEGGWVTMTVEAVGDSACLTIEDNGRGIAADRMSSLFDSLRPLDINPATGRPLRREGLGLGLAVARGMIELNHGSVRAESAGPGCGSAFTLTLPLSVPSLSGDRIGPIDRQNAGTLSTVDDEDRGAIEAVAGLTVLIIDTDADARDLLRVALASLGAKPATAADVDLGVDLLMARTPDVLLCDSALSPDHLSLLSFAVDAVQRERAQVAEDGAPRMPAVVATDDCDMPGPPDRIGESLHCDARLRKPVSLRKLALAIAEARSVPAPAALRQ